MKKKLLKRLLVPVLSAAMVFGTCGTSLAAAGTDTAAAAEETVSAAAEDETVSTAATLETDSDGYYLITSGDDMDAFAEIVLTDTDANARLTQDITLNDDYVPIGTDSLSTSSDASTTYAYAGTFDGQGYTISGLSISGDYYYAGLFAYVTSGSVIKDLTVNGSVSGSGYLAGVAAYAAGDVTIQNVVSNVNLTAASSHYVGGILAYAVSGSEVEILACENNGDISSAKSYVGGIAGYLAGPANVIGCRNTGDIEVYSYAGGIVGYDAKTSSQSQFIGCANTGDITVTLNAVGGITAYLYGIVQYCFNTGKITTGGTTRTYNGGIVGYLQGSGSSAKALVDSCFNAGSFDNSTGYFGGIVGTTYTSAKYQSITNCYNTADVGSSAITRAGGIVDSVYYTTAIENCYNIGTITASNYAGEIASYPSSSTGKMSGVVNCYYLSSSSNGASGRGNTVSGASSVDSDTLKGYAQTLGDAYKTDSDGVNGGYPILTYQGLTVKEVKALMEEIDLDTSDMDDIGYAYAAYYCLSDKDQAKVFVAAADTLTVTKTVSTTDTNGYVLSSELTSSISDTSYTFTLYKADDASGTNAAAVSAVSYVLTDTSGTETECVTGSDGSFTLKDGETATFGGGYTATLGSAIDMDTAGYYYVAESDTAVNYETSWTQTTAVSDAEVADASGRTSSYVPVTGGADNIDEVTFDCTNTYEQDVVSVTKTVSDTNASGVTLSDSMQGYLVSRSFSFTLYESGTVLANESYSVYEGETLVSTGNATGTDGTFTLSGGQTAIFASPDMTGEVSYSVTENDLDTSLWTASWSAVSSASAEAVTSGATSSGSVSLTGTASAVDTIDFTCTNTYAYDSVLIYTVADLIAFSEAVTAGYNPDAIVMADIDASAADLEPIGGELGVTSLSSYPNCYTGTFDGNDHTITIDIENTGSTRIYFTGLFGGLGSGGVIQDLTLKGTVSGGAYIGGIVAYATGGTIRNVTNEAAVLSTKGGSVGGIVGYSTSSALQITNCVNNGTVSDETISLGGLGCGGIFGQGCAVITGCTNNGAISSSCYSVAGIAGLLSDGSLTGSLNYGTVTGMYNVAGIVGNCSGSVQYCGNNGAITTSGSVSAYGGGVVGYLSGSGASVDSCCNKAEVSGTTRNGGVVGLINGSSSYTTSVTNCYNTGSVSSSAGSAGGVAAYLYYSSELKNCYNAGELSSSASTAYLGGVVARMSGTSTPTAVSNNYALNTVDSAASYNASSVTEDMMKLVDSDTLKTYATVTTDEDGNTTASVLGSAYKEDTTSINGGYPILLWEYHTYEVSWTWAEDYSTAELILTCTDGDDTQTAEATVTSEVLAAATCTADGVQTYTATATYNGVEYTDTQTVTIAAAGHTYGLPSYIWADDCSSVAATFTCSVCGDVQTVTVTDITSETTAATCTEAGLITYTATVTFEDTEHTAATSVVLDATGHDYDDGVVTTEATCTEDGVLTYTCKNDSSHTYTEAIPATGHSYEAVVTEPTCTEGGYTTYTCSVCGDSYVDDYTDAFGHSYDEGVVTTEATCTEDGVLTYTCKNDSSHTYTEAIPATGHDYDDGVVTTEATCTEDGVLTYTCKNDSSHTYTEAITATGHSYEAVVTEPTCTEGGYTTYTCSVCSDTYTADETAATGHDYDDGVVTTEATCTEDGVLTYTCKNDSSHTYTEAIPATGHSYEAVVTEPTCTEGGYTTYTCSVCGDTYTANETEATGHSYGSDGYCTVCGDYSAEADETNTAQPSEDDTSGGTTEGGTTGDGTTGGGTTEGSSYTLPSSKIAAEKVSLTGATVEQVTQTLAKLTNDGDLADSTYYLLQAKAKKTTKKSVRLSWKKVDGAASYVVYANACGKNKKLKMYKVTSKTSLNITKVAGKKLSSGKYYKFLVIALDADGKVIQTSKVIHAATKGGSVTNAKSVTLYKSGKKISSLTLTKGKSAKVTAKVTKQDKKKKIQNHRKTKYESSNKKIATVTANGRIKAKAKGTCYIYAYAQNGVCRKIKVTVK